MTYDPEMACPIRFTSVRNPNDLDSLEQGAIDEEDIIQQPVVISSEQGNGLSKVFEQEALISAWIDKGQDPFNRQPFELHQLRTPRFSTSALSTTA